MKTILWLLIFPICLPASGQQKRYDIALSYGLYTAPTLKQSHFRDYMAADFNYQLTNRWIIGSGFTAGRFDYYEDVRSNADTELTKYTTASTNARGYDAHMYALVKYSLINSSRFHLLAGAGIGLLTQRLKYPYRQPCSSGCVVFIGEESSTKIELPIKAEAYYLVNDKIGVGVTAGGFVNSTLSNTGIHFGPQIRVSL